MDQDKARKPEFTGKNEPARHISMELQADGARVTNLSMDGNRLILTIEAELSSSQVKATGSAPAPQPAPAVREDDDTAEADSRQRGDETSELAEMSIAPEEPNRPVADGPAAGKRLDQIFSLGVAPQSRSGASGSAGVGIIRIPDEDETAYKEPAPSSPAFTAAPASAAMAGEREIPRESGFGAPPAHRFPSDSPEADTADFSGPEADAVKNAAPATTARQNHATNISPLLGIVGLHEADAAKRREERSPSVADQEPAEEGEIATQPISYAALEGEEGSDFPIPAKIGEEAAPTPAEAKHEASEAESACGRADAAADILDSLRPPAAGLPESGEETPAGRIMKVEPSDMEDEPAISEESSAIGGDRHGEPLPSLAFGFEPIREVPPPLPAEPDSTGGEPFPERDPFPETDTFPESEPLPSPEAMPEPASFPPPPAPLQAAPEKTPTPTATRDSAPEPMDQSSSTPAAMGAAGAQPPKPEAVEPPKPAAGGTTVLIRYTCPKCKTQGMQAVDKVGTVVNCSNCGKAMRLVMKK